MCRDWTGAEASWSEGSFDDAVVAFRQAQVSFWNGDPDPAMELYSQRDDVTLANPLGPPRRGPTEVTRAAADAAAQVSDGSICGFEEVSRYSAADLGYVVQIERVQARLIGGGHLTPISLRATIIFRHEGDTWKIVHRHADPITTPRPISTVIDT
jgi:ketosteroid isomerase-like protein